MWFQVKLTRWNDLKMPIKNKHSEFLLIFVYVSIKLVETEEIQTCHFTIVIVDVFICTAIGF